MYILVSLLLLIIGILFLPLTLQIRAKEKNTYFETELCIMLLGFILYCRRNHGDCLKLICSKLEKSSRTDASSQNKPHSSKIIFLLLHIGKMKKLVWHSEIGLADASQTAIATGIIQGVQGITRKTLLQYTSCRTDIYCQPNFKNAVIRNELICIVGFSSGNIIKEIVKGYLKDKWREAV